MKKKQRDQEKDETAKGVDPRINNNDAELHQTDEAADDRARVREQAGPGPGTRR